MKISRPPKGFAIVNAAPGTMDLYIYSFIGSSWFGDGVTAKQVKNALRDAGDDVEQINVYINSPGGDVFEGVTIYNLLARHKANVTVYIDGLAASAASVVAMAGDEIRIAENAMVMVHNPAGIVVGYAADMRQYADTLDKVADTIVATYAARTGQTPKKIAELMDAETWMDADEAIELGFATEQVAAKKVAACVDIGIFKNAPATLLARPDTAAEPAATPQGEMAMPENAATPVTPPPATAPSEPVLATLPDLKAKFPQADSDFIVQCLTDKVTLDAARDRWFGGIQAKLDATVEQRDELAAQVDALAKQVFDLKAAAQGTGTTPVGAPPKDRATPHAQTPEGWKAEYEASAELRAEFSTAETYVAYMKAESDKRVHIKES